MRGSSLEVSRVVLVALVSLSAFCAGHLLRAGDAITAQRLALATTAIVLISAALASNSRGDDRAD
ncbi:MAG TPA: hypothetical protein VHM19_20460 [Polyangiales bacterium]|jgi:hypothetical protein|nr:hypothetical protein [Polyangiales bacterium]